MRMRAWSLKLDRQLHYSRLEVSYCARSEGSGASMLVQHVAADPASRATGASLMCLKLELGDATPAAAPLSSTCLSLTLSHMHAAGAPLHSSACAT